MMSINISDKYFLLELQCLIKYFHSIYYNMYDKYFTICIINISDLYNLRWQKYLQYSNIQNKFYKYFVNTICCLRYDKNKKEKI